MPAKNKVYTRSQQKYDTEAHWKLATGFVPLAGEVIVYAPDETHDNARIKIGDGHTPVNSLLFVEQTCAPTANLLGLLHPNNLKVEYSTQGTGWLCQVVDNNGNQLARKYFTQGVPTEWTHYSIPFTTGTGSYVTMSIRKAAEDADYVPGEFAFDNFAIALNGQTESINLLKNGDFENGRTGWTIHYPNEVYIGLQGADMTNSILFLQGIGENFKYKALLEQTVQAMPNSTYEFRYWAVPFDSTAQVRIHFYDQTGTKLKDVYENITTSGYHSVQFSTNANTTSIRMAIHGKNDTWFDNMSLKLRLPTFKNGDFSNGVTDWETASTYNSDYVPEEIVTENNNSYIKTRCDQIGLEHTSSVFIKQTHLYTDPNTTYTLEFDLKRLSESATWQDYTTIMEQDKFALMNENTIGAGEYPKFGGPWANALHYDYILRCVIEKPESVHFDLSHVGLLTNIVSALGSEVIVEGRGENGWFHVARQEFDENIGWAETVPDKSKIVPCNDLQDNEFDAIRITLTFKNDSTMVDEDFQPTKNFLKGIRLYGHSDTSLPECELPMRQDYFGNVHCSNEVRAVKFIGDIDDGCLDWGCN